MRVAHAAINITIVSGEYQQKGFGWIAARIIAYSDAVILK